MAKGAAGSAASSFFRGQCRCRTPDEEFILTELELKQGERLACCTYAQSDLAVHIPRDSLITGQRLQVAADLREIAPDPLIRAYSLALSPPTLEDLRPDLTRIADELAKLGGPTTLSAETAVLQSISPFVRERDWRFTAFVRGQDACRRYRVGKSAAGPSPSTWAPPKLPLIW